MIVEDGNDDIAMAVKDRKVIKAVTEMVVSCEKSAEPVARFAASQVSNAVKDINVENCRNVGYGSSSPSSGPPSYALSESDLSKHFGSKTRRKRHKQAKNGHKA